MRLVLATEAFRYVPLEEAFEQISAVGFRAVGLHTRQAWDPHIVPARCRGKELKRLRRALAANRLEVASIRGFANLASEEGMAQLGHELALAAELQCPVVQVAAPRPERWLSSIEQMKAFRGEQIRRLRAAAKEAEQAEVTLCVEMFPGGFFTSSLELGELLREAAHPCLKYILCTVHAILLGETLDAAFDAAGDLIGYVHVADVSDDEHEHLPPGRGKVSFARLMELLAAEEYDGDLEVDIGSCVEDPVAAGRQSLEYMSKLL